MKSLFLLIGAPGSGKTTNAQIISKQNEHIAHFSTGELLRKEANSASELGKVIEKCIDAGELVPVKIALDTIIKAINSSSHSTILIDGYPRSVEQMMALDETLKSEKDILLKSVIEVVVSEEIAMSRAIGRNRGIDDSVEVFKNRMKIYTKPLKPIQDFYSSKKIVHKIDGEREIEAVVEDMNHFIATHS